MNKVLCLLCLFLLNIIPVETSSLPLNPQPDLELSCEKIKKWISEGRSKGCSTCTELGGHEKCPETCGKWCNSKRKLVDDLSAIPTMVFSKSPTKSSLPTALSSIPTLVYTGVPTSFPTTTGLHTMVYDIHTLLVGTCSVSDSESGKLCKKLIGFHGGSVSRVNLTCTATSQISNSGCITSNQSTLTAVSEMTAIFEMKVTGQNRNTLIKVVKEAYETFANLEKRKITLDQKFLNATMEIYATSSPSSVPSNVPSYLEPSSTPSSTPTDIPTVTLSESPTRFPTTSASQNPTSIVGCKEDEDCNDNNECTEDKCLENKICHNIKLDNCCLQNSDCNDDNNCTKDRCKKNLCRNKKLKKCCLQDTDCSPRYKKEKCKVLKCSFDEKKKYNKCKTDYKTKTGSCSEKKCEERKCPASTRRTLTSSRCDSNEDCNDGNKCTADVCKGNTCTDAGCVQGFCHYKGITECCNNKLDCNDQDSCTKDECENSECRNEQITDCCNESRLCPGEFNSPSTCSVYKCKKTTERCVFDFDSMCQETECLLGTCAA